MNKTISTRAGLITGMLIVAFILLIKPMNLRGDSPIILLQYLFVFLGMLGSSFMLHKYYADVSMLDGFKHNIRTLATTLVIVLICTTVLFFVLNPKETPLLNLTWILGFTISSYSLSGLLSAFIASFIFNTFTKKK